MYQVVVLPPPESLGDVEEIRRRHDPAFHRTAAHLPLLRAFEPASAELIDRFDHLRPGKPFTVTLGAPTAHASALVLPVIAGAADLVRVRALAAAALLPPEAVAQDDAPALLVGHFTADAEQELVRRGLVASPPPGTFRVTELTLLMEDSRGLWHPVRQCALR